MAVITSSNQYKYTGRGPLDTKALVKTFKELTTKETWIVNGVSIAYNGMTTAVWLDEDPSKNGLYVLHDPATLSIIQAPDVTREANWHKLAELNDITAFTEKLSYIKEYIDKKDSILYSDENTAFKIKRCTYSQLFPVQGESNITIEEGCWYLCTDTTDLFVGTAVEDSNGKTTYRPERINKSIADVVDGLVAEVEDIEYFQQIQSRLELPNKNSNNFNPNITYYRIEYLDQTAGEEDDEDAKYIIYTYTYDRSKERYICSTSTNNIACVSSVEIIDGKLVIYYPDGTHKEIEGVVGSNSAFNAIKIGDAVYSETDEENNLVLPDFVKTEDLSTKVTEVLNVSILCGGDCDPTDD
jgi:hypothetical protein